MTAPDRAALRAVHFSPIRDLPQLFRYLGPLPIFTGALRRFVRALCSARAVTPRSCQGEGCVFALALAKEN